MKFEGLALYLRKISAARHGSPAKLAKQFADNGLKWVAIGGPWQEPRGGVVRTGLINSVDTIHRYADAFYDKDVTPFVWGYPWQGAELEFADKMAACSGDYGNALLDPEKGSNPKKTPSGRGKDKANAHAALLVQLMAERFNRPTDVVGLSTYGSGVKMRWFPLAAFMQALAKAFPGRTFAGGQTYTKDKHINPSIADFVTLINMVADLDTIKLVPNYGLYKFVMNAGKRRAKSKLPLELRAHLHEFIDEAEPVHGMIGWAENFCTKRLWQELALFAELMERGACRLPA